MWHRFLQWLEQNSLTCTFQKHFGFSCPGCGFQRAIVYLLQGKIWESIQTFPALIPILLLVLLFFLDLKYHFTWGSKALKLLLILSFASLITPYLLHIINTSSFPTV
ncbi:DUF2752 domain-containing protein [Ancylomarina longa]|uniref:DUF2752 domain-containing protein n=1 Tax=Ancylomarina longa TaxID=2487017 RepID=A0A434ATX6_9BACT|nr:DUF2752 domain-containing protein [Ancylomarina longa]